MKVLSLIPKIMAVEPAVNWSGTKAKNTLFIYPFQGGFEELCLEECERVKPDLVLMFAFGEGPFCPDPEKVKRIKEKFPIVYIATDGGCKGLWPALEYFKGSFSAVVNIDGSHEFPKGLIDLVTLSPLDQGRYSYRPHLRDRDIRLGFMGGEGAIGTPRRDICDELEAEGGLLTRGTRNEAWGSNFEYTAFMLRSKAIINFPQTGLGNIHVKARCLEAGLAASVLLEQSCSILRNYFTPGEDFFEWTTTDDVKRILDLPLDVRQRAADSFRKKVLIETDPDLWLEKVLRVI